MSLSTRAASTALSADPSWVENAPWSCWVGTPDAGGLLSENMGTSMVLARLASHEVRRLAFRSSTSRATRTRAPEVSRLDMAASARV